MAASYWALQICAKHFHDYLKPGKGHRFRTWRGLFFSQVRKSQVDSHVPSRKRVQPKVLRFAVFLFSHAGFWARLLYMICYRRT